MKVYVHRWVGKKGSVLDENIKPLAKTIFEALREIKGQDIIGLDLAPVQSYADVIFVASGNNIRQVQALANNIQKCVFEAHRRHPLGVEGYENAQWVLVDYGDVICHIFFEETRKAYKIEDMWPSVIPMNEAKLISLFSPPKAAKASTPSKNPVLKAAAKTAKKSAPKKAKKLSPAKPKKKAPKPAAAKPAKKSALKRPVRKPIKKTKTKKR